MKYTPLNSVFLAGTLLSLASCGQGEDYSMLSAASPQEVQQTSDYPAVVMVVMPGGAGLCTGTFISPRAVITASHCTKANGNYSVYTTFGWYQTSVKEKLGPGVIYDPTDISVLIFDHDIADPTLSQVIPLGGQPKLADEIRIVGYGCNDLSTKLGSGVKRTGTNKIFKVTDFLELASTPNQRLLASLSTTSRILGPENQAGSCFGDSGGPMLQIQDGIWKLTGTTHGGGWSSDSMIRSLYVNLSRQDNDAFLRDIDADYSLHLFDGCWTSSDADACGPATAQFGIFSFLENILLKVLSWFHL